MTTPEWVSSDPSIASINDMGVVTGLRRGSAVVEARGGGVRASLTVSVTARLRIEPDRRSYGIDNWTLAVGDTLRFVARYIDVDGKPIGETPDVTWTSSNTEGVPVTQDGVASGRIAGARSNIVARTTDAVDTIPMTVSQVVAGQPASLRLVHAALDLGPVRFVLSKGADVTLAYGGSVDIPFTSGSFYVDTEGLPAGDLQYRDRRSYSTLIAPGEHLTLVAVGGLEQGALVPAWADLRPVSPDSVRVRLVQGWNQAPVVSLLELRAPAPALPDLCYFDPLETSPYYMRAAADFDVLLQEKRPTSRDLARITIAPRGGTSMTLVIVGSGSGALGILQLTDPLSK